jgi:hypothetical protein
MNQQNIFDEMPVLDRMDLEEMEVWEPEEDVIQKI